MTKSRWFSIFLLVCCGVRVTAQSSLESKIVSKVSQMTLRYTVRDLVRCGNRLGGTKSGDRSAKYVFERFRSFGYKPEMINDPEQLTYTNSSWHIRVVSPTRLRGLIQHEWLAGFSPSVRERVSKLTFVRSIRDIEKERIDGGAVLIDHHPSEKMYNELVDAGANCILTYEVFKSPAYSNCAMITTLREKKDQPIPVFDVSNFSGQRLKSEMERGTSVTIKYSAKTIIAPGNPKTVIATLKGESDEYYILCAHGDSDSGGPGADDNASGVSGVLELSRILHMLMNDKTLPLPQKSIRFTIWGSEYASSSSYVKLHEKELDKIKGVINFDEIGIARPRNCIYFEGNDIEHNRDLLRIFEKIGEDYAGRRAFWKEATTNPSQGGTDSYVFLPKYLDRLDVPDVKIPSITVYTAAWNEPKTMKQTEGWHSKAWKGDPDSVVIGYSPYYHSSLDIPKLTTDKEPADMAWAVNAVGIAFIRLLWQ